MAEARRRPDPEQALAVLDQYQRQLDAVARQIQFLQALLTEATRAKASLAGLKAEPTGELLVPLGANTFIHAKAAQKGKALMGIGAGINVERSWDDAEAQLSKREDEIQTEIQRLNEAGLRLQQEAAALEEEMQAGVQS